jgi:hypothetical protein
MMRKKPRKNRSPEKKVFLKKARGRRARGGSAVRKRRQKAPPKARKAARVAEAAVGKIRDDATHSPPRMQ